MDGSVVMPHAVVESGAKVYNAIIAEDAVIKSGAVIGAPSAEGETPVITVIGPDCVIEENQIIPAGAVIDCEDLKKEGTDNG